MTLRDEGVEVALAPYWAASRASTSGVCMRPTEIELQRTPRAAYCTPTALLNCTSPAFAAA